MISSHWGAEEQEKGHGGYVLEEVCGTFRTLLVFKPESWTRSQLVVVKRDLARERHVSALAEVTGLLRVGIRSLFVFFDASIVNTRVRHSVYLSPLTPPS